MKKLGIIAGSGGLPAQLIEACIGHNRPYFVLGMKDFADETLLSGKPHAIVPLGAVGESIKILRKEGVEEIILAGRVGRPSLSALRPDIATTKFIAKFGTQVFNGDDALLSAVIQFLESEGFTVVGVENILSDLLAAPGTLGAVQPDAKAKEDIALGLRAAHTLGALDIGQSVVIEEGYILAVEAAEGTKELLARSKDLKKIPAPRGVLVKAKKPAQTMRADLPTIGPDTITQAHAAGLAGIAVEAGGVIILDVKEVIKRADQLGVFVTGISDVRQ